LRTRYTREYLGAKREEITGWWKKKFLNKELFEFYSSANIIRVIE
jgi:hypothetical protein